MTTKFISDLGPKSALIAPRPLFEKAILMCPMVVPLRYPFCVKLDAFSVFTGYVFGCKRSLQMKYTSKLRLNKQISRNLHRYNAYSRLGLPDVTCFHTVNLAHLVTSLTS